MLDTNLPGSLVDGGVGLDEYLSRLLVLEDNIPDLGAPEVLIDSSHVSVEFGAVLYIRGALVDMQLLEVFTNRYKTFQLAKMSRTAVKGASTYRPGQPSES